MPYPTGTLLPRSRFARENFAKGEAVGEAKGETKGIAKAVLQVLDLRGIELTPAARDYISGCLHLDLARTWLDEVLTVTSYTDLTYLAVL